MGGTKDAPDDGDRPRLSDTIRVIRAAGGSDWDKIDDVAAYLGRDDPEGAEISRLRAEVARLAAELRAQAGLRAEIEAENAGLWSVVVRPWVREGDGKRLWKVNLAWFDTAETEAEAREMVGRIVSRAAVRATAGPGGGA